MLDYLECCALIAGKGQLVVVVVIVDELLRKVELNVEDLADLDRVG